MAKYTKTITSCTNVKTFCAAYTVGTDYTCPGHTNRVTSSSDPKYNGSLPSFANYQAYPGSGNYTIQNIIKNGDINTLRHILQEEINMRMQHSLYSSQFKTTLGEDVQAGTKVHHSQQNLVASVLAELAETINNINSSAGDGNHTVPDSSQYAEAGNEIRAQDLKSLENLLTGILNDCICYSDCTNYKVSKKTVVIDTGNVCSCHGNCACVYW